MATIDHYHSALGLRLATGTAFAIVLLGAFFSMFSGCIASPYAHLDPLVISPWVDKVAELMSFATMLQYTPQKVPGFYGFPLMTLGFAVAALVRSNPADRFRRILGIVTLAALIGFSFWEMRGTAAASMVAAPIFAASLTVLWPHSPRKELAPLGGHGIPDQLCAVGPFGKAVDRCDLQAAGNDRRTRCIDVSVNVGCRCPGAASERTRHGADRSWAGDSCRDRSRGFCRTIPSQQRWYGRDAQADAGATIERTSDVVGSSRRLRGDLRDGSRSEYPQARSRRTGRTAWPWRNARLSRAARSRPRIKDFRLACSQIDRAEAPGQEIYYAAWTFVLRGTRRSLASAACALDTPAS